jgi:hypothetical protein
MDRAWSSEDFVDLSAFGVNSIQTLAEAAT